MGLNHFWWFICIFLSYSTATQNSGEVLLKSLDYHRQGIRARVFATLPANDACSRLAKQCLLAIEEYRNEKRRINDEPRHLEIAAAEYGRRRPKLNPCNATFELDDPASCRLLL